MRPSMIKTQFKTNINYLLDNMAHTWDEINLIRSAKRDNYCFEDLQILFQYRGAFLYPEKSQKYI